MKVQLIFKMNTLPLSYRLGTLSIIKEMIRNGSKDYYQKIFVENRSEMKPFTYGVFVPNINVQPPLIYGEELHLTVSSPSYELIMHLMNGSNRTESYTYQGYSLQLKRKQMLPQVTLDSNVVTFKTMSPILIESKDKRPVLSTDANFQEEFQYVASLIINECFQRDPYQTIYIRHIDMKKQVIKENLHQSSDRPLFLTANKGLIQLEGHPEDLQCLYDAGASFRRSLGFGMLEVVDI